MIFDLDPDPTGAFSHVKHAAPELASVLKCTGALHIVVPLAPNSQWDDVKAWALAFAHTMVAEAPEKYMATITKSKRLGKILIDFF